MRRLLFPLVLLGMSCGDPQSTPPDPFVPPDMNGDLPIVTNDMGGDTDPNNPNNPPDLRCDNVDCEIGEKCVRGDCVPQSAKLACDEVQDLGILAIADTHTISGDTTGFVDTLSTTCGMEGDFNGAENAFRFQVDKDAMVTFNLTTTSAVNWLMEVRRSSCMDDSDIAICNTSENISFPVTAGQTYTLIVEPEVGINKGAFTITATFVERVCPSPGARTCVDGNIEECRVSGLVMLECPDGCTDGVCHGDRCDNAIEVTASTSFEGNINALASEINFGSEPTCSTNGTNGIPSPGQDLFLKLPGLTAGQVVTIDASMDNQDDVIGIVRDCAAALVCVGAVDLGDRWEWTVTEDGDWYVIVDNRQPSSGTYSFTVDIQ